MAAVCKKVTLIQARACRIFGIRSGGAGAVLSLAMILALRYSPAPAGFRPASHLPCASVAQLDRAPGFEPGCRRFESFRARHKCRFTSRVLSEVSLR